MGTKTGLLKVFAALAFLNMAPNGLVSRVLAANGTQETREDIENIREIVMETSSSSYLDNGEKVYEWQTQARGLPKVFVDVAPYYTILQTVGDSLSTFAYDFENDGQAELVFQVEGRITDEKRKNINRSAIVYLRDHKDYEKFKKEMKDIKYNVFYDDAQGVYSAEALHVDFVCTTDSLRRESKNLLDDLEEK